MKEKLFEIEETANKLDGLTLILMTCAEKGDLPAEAYVESLELANALAVRIADMAKEATA